MTNQTFIGYLYTGKTNKSKVAILMGPLLKAANACAQNHSSGTANDLNVDADIVEEVVNSDGIKTNPSYYDSEWECQRVYAICDPTAGTYDLHITPANHPKFDFFASLGEGTSVTSSGSPVKLTGPLVYDETLNDDGKIVATFRYWYNHFVRGRSAHQPVGDSFAGQGRCLFDALMMPDVYEGIGPDTIRLENIETVGDLKFATQLWFKKFTAEFPQGVWSAVERGGKVLQGSALKMQHTVVDGSGVLGQFVNNITLDDIVDLENPHRLVTNGCSGPSSLTQSFVNGINASVTTMYVTGNLLDDSSTALRSVVSALSRKPDVESALCSINASDSRRLQQRNGTDATGIILDDFPAELIADAGTPIISTVSLKYDLTIIGSNKSAIEACCVQPKEDTWTVINHITHSGGDTSLVVFVIAGVVLIAVVVKLIRAFGSAESTTPEPASETSTRIETSADAVVAVQPVGFLDALKFFQAQDDNTAVRP